MKKVLQILKFSLIVLLIAGGTYVLYVFLRPPVFLSLTQSEIRRYYGIPEQFAISYLPRQSDDGTEYVRYEIWYYPEAGRKVTFMAGDLMRFENLVADDSIISAAKYKPEDFDILTNYNELERVFSGSDLRKMELPGLFDENIETYTTDDALFVMENGYLTYLQTYNECIEGPCLGNEQYLRF